MEELVVEFGGDRHPFINKMVAIAAVCQSQSEWRAFSLQHLTSVYLQNDDLEMAFSLEPIAAFLELPSVRRANFGGISDDIFTLSDRTPLPVQPTLSGYRVIDLTIRDSVIVEEIILFLGRCTSLKRLSYEHSASQKGVAGLVPQKFGKAIAHLKCCLEELIIFDDPIDEVMRPVDEMPTAIGSLAEFKELHTITMNADILLGPISWFRYFRKTSLIRSKATPPVQSRLEDILPKSLKALRLADCRVGILDQVRQLLNRKEEVAPNLMVICLNFRYTGWIPPTSSGSYKGYDEEVAQKLKADCVAAGFLLIFSFSNWNSREIQFPGSSFDGE
jgi:hypothetical protein